MMKFDQTLGQQADFGMPVSGGALVASVRALPMTGAASVVAAGWTCGHADASAVTRYRGTADVAVIKGAFPGTSAWSPPIE